MSEHTPLTEAERAALWEKRCVFCPIIEGDAPATVVERGDRHIAFVPLGPHVPGHVLFVPTQHLPDATVNPEAAAVVFAEAARYVAEQGFAANIITSIGAAATQSVPHLHIHVVPRGPSDGLDSRWPWLVARTSTATTDTGLRERVEALADEMSRDLCECEIHWTARLQAILDATAAPTTDTGARDE